MFAIGRRASPRILRQKRRLWNDILVDIFAFVPEGADPYNFLTAISLGAAACTATGYFLHQYFFPPYERLPVHAALQLLQEIELDDGMHLVIGTAAARELKSLPPDGELFIITGFGAARKGKSTILTILGDFFTRQSYQLFGEPTFVSEFPIGDSWSTVTDGVWMSYPIPLNAEKTQHIIFLDTEGSDRGNNTLAAKLLAILPPFSDVMVQGAWQDYNDRDKEFAEICRLDLVFANEETEFFQDAMKKSTRLMVVVPTSLDRSKDHTELLRDSSLAHFNQRAICPLPQLDPKVDLKDIFDLSSRVRLEYKVVFNHIQHWLQSGMPVNIFSGPDFHDTLQLAVQDLNRVGKIELNALKEQVSQAQGRRLRKRLIDEFVVKLNSLDIDYNSNELFWENQVKKLKKEYEDEFSERVERIPHTHPDNCVGRLSQQMNSAVLEKIQDLKSRGANAFQMVRASIQGGDLATDMDQSDLEVQRESSLCIIS